MLPHKQAQAYPTNYLSSEYHRIPNNARTGNLTERKDIRSDSCEINSESATHGHYHRKVPDQE